MHQWCMIHGYNDHWLSFPILKRCFFFISCFFISQNCQIRLFFSCFWLLNKLWLKLELDISIWTAHSLGDMFLNREVTLNREITLNSKVIFEDYFTICRGGGYFKNTAKCFIWGHYMVTTCPLYVLEMLNSWFKATICLEKYFRNLSGESLFLTLCMRK